MLPKTSIAVRPLAAACVTAAMVISGCGGKPGDGAAAPGTTGGGKGGVGASSRTAPAPIAVTLAPVIRRSLDETVAVTGTLFGEEDTVISARLAGRVVAVERDVGDVVEPGVRLAQIEQRDYQLALDERRAATGAALAKLGLSALPSENYDENQLPAVVKARAEASNAEAKYQRARQLFEQTPPLIAEQDFADIRTSWEVARSQADVELLTNRALLAEARAAAAAGETATQRLADTSVLAPVVPGRPDLRYRVAERSVSIGEYVEPGRAMFRLVASDRIKYRVRVPERYGGSVKMGQSARATVDRGRTFTPGRVARVAPVVDPQNRTFLVEIEIDNASGTLKPGAFAEGTIILGARENAALVPAQAVITFAGVHRVFSVKDGQAVEHRVQLGARVDGLVEIVGDFAPDRVVSTGAGALTKGAAVTVREP